MSGGIGVDDGAIAAYQELLQASLEVGASSSSSSSSSSSDEAQLQFQIFMVDNEDWDITHAETGDSIERLAVTLPDNEPRYILTAFDFFDEKANLFKHSILFLLWVPAAARIKQKMIYVSSLDSFHRRLRGRYDRGFSDHDGWKPLLPLVLVTNDEMLRDNQKEREKSRGSQYSGVLSLKFTIDELRQLAEEHDTEALVRAPYLKSASKR